MYLLYTYVFLNYFIYYLAALGLSCGNWDLPLQYVGSLVVTLGLSCFTACRISVPQSGMEFVSPALQGRLLTTEPPGKSQSLYLLTRFTHLTHPLSLTSGDYQSVLSIRESGFLFCFQIPHISEIIWHLSFSI